MIALSLSSELTQKQASSRIVTSAYPAHEASSVNLLSEGRRVLNITPSQFSNPELFGTTASPGINRSPPAHVDALRECTAEEISHIRTVLRRLTAQRVENPDDAEDLVQDTFLTMTQKARDLALQKGLMVWGMAILRKKVGNYYRRGQRFVSLEAMLSKKGIGNAPRSPSCPDLEAQYVEMRAVVEEIVGGLAAPERRVMRQVLAGFSVQEIVDEHYPERYQNIVNRVHRGRQKLYQQLKKYGYQLPEPRKNRRRQTIDD